MWNSCKHTHSDRHSSRVNLLIFKKIRKDVNSFFRSFPPFSVFVCPLFIHLQTEWCMNTETIHILIAACTLIAAGITSFPYRLSYGNTSWLPWWMQPDCRYLERPYEYDYPARNINLLFSVLFHNIHYIVANNLACLYHHRYLQHNSKHLLSSTLSLYS